MGRARGRDDNEKEDDDEDDEDGDIDDDDDDLLDSEGGGEEDSELGEEEFGEDGASPAHVPASSAPRSAMPTRVVCASPVAGDSNFDDGEEDSEVGEDGEEGDSEVGEDGEEDFDEVRHTCGTLLAGLRLIRSHTLGSRCHQLTERARTAFGAGWRWRGGQRGCARLEEEENLSPATRCGATRGAFVTRLAGWLFDGGGSAAGLEPRCRVGPGHGCRGGGGVPGGCRGSGCAGAVPGWVAGLSRDQGSELDRTYTPILHSTSNWTH